MHRLMEIRFALVQLDGKYGCPGTDRGNDALLTFLLARGSSWPAFPPSLSRVRVFRAVEREFEMKCPPTLSRLEDSYGRRVCGQGS